MADLPDIITDSLLEDEFLLELKPVSELVVDERGAFIGKTSERLQVKFKDKPVKDIPLLYLRQVLLIGEAITISTDAIYECAQRDIPLHFMKSNGKVIASVYSTQFGGTAKTRREQFAAYHDHRGVILAKAFISGKIMHQLNLLRYMTKNRARSEPDKFQLIRQSVGELFGLVKMVKTLGISTIDEGRGFLLNLEGRSAKIYWQAAKELALSKVNWPGRTGRGASDLGNSLFNYGYGILYSKVEQAVLLAGLDPFAGFIHTDRPGKPSLVLDLIEEFRQPVVDRSIFALINLNVKLEQEPDGLLTRETRQTVAHKIMERLEEGRELYEGKRQTLQNILTLQAAHIATFVRGDLNREYTPFESSW